MDITSLKTNADLENAGVWKKMEDASFLIASSNNPKYQRALTRAAKLLSPGKRNEAQAITDLTVEAMADHILLDFEGVTEGKTVIKPTRENKVKLLKIPAFRNWVAEQCQDIANFQAEETEAEKAELKQPSSGSPDTETPSNI